MNSLAYFFSYSSDLPEDVGFSLYGSKHLTVLAIILISTILIANKYKKIDQDGQQRVDLTISGLMILWIVIRTFFLIIIGKMSVYELPLHLCSLAGIFCFIYCFKKWKFLGELLYTLCLPGTILALIFPDWVKYPILSMISLGGFLFHAGVFTFITCQMVSNKIKPTIKNLWQTVLFLCVLVPPILIFDKKVNANYLFVNWPSKGSPLEWIASFMGVPGYLFGYALLILLLIFLMEIGYMIFTRRNPH